MITLSQIKAARALLGWTQDDLAASAGLSLPSINNLERGLYSPRSETLASIVATLEAGGIEFTAQNGVRMRQTDHDIISYTGKNFIHDLDQDILSQLKSSDDEIIGMTFDDNKWMEYAGVTNPQYVRAREERKWKERFLIPENATFITSPPKSYKTLPAHMFGKINYEIYNSRLALIEWEAMRVTLIKNAIIVDQFKKQFEVLWGLAKPFTTARLRKVSRLNVEKEK